MTDTLPLNHEDIRRSRMPAHPVNEDLAAYVQSHAFQLSLSRRMISTLSLLWRARDVEIGTRVWVHDISAGQALSRRGLLVHHGEVVPRAPAPELTGEQRRAKYNADRAEFDARRVSDLYEVTRAGQLVLMLLAEAGLVDPRQGPLPPPPPDWVDPRPQIEVEL